MATQAKAYANFTLVDLTDGLIWQADSANPPANPQDNWAYYNTTNKTSYAYYNGEWYKLSSDGQDGQKGSDGRGIQETIVEYQVGISGTQEPTGTWYRTVQSTTPGQFLWTRTTIKYTSGADTYSFSVAAHGQDGSDGGIYPIVTSEEQIYKSYTKIDGDYSVVWDPEILEIVIPSVCSLGVKFYSDGQEYVLTPQELADYLIFENNIYRLNIKNIVDANFDEEGVGSSKLTLFQNLLNGANGFFTIIATINNEIVSSEAIQISYKIDESMAQFAVETQKIVASIKKSAFVFTEDGLIINNGGLKIIQNMNENNPLLEYNSETESLYIKGNGEFTGTIYATDGSFTGTVYATGGEFTGSVIAENGIIGGFIIGQNSIISAGYQKTTDETYVPDKKYYELVENEGEVSYQKTEDTSFEAGKDYYEYVANGSIELYNDSINNSGIIRVDNIELGSGATITDYIQLGNSYIYNPAFHNNTFIEVTDGNENHYITIKNNGEATFGNIIIDGVNSVIYGGIPGYYDSFRITTDRSVFKNVDVTGTIHSSVFETGQIQTVGGGMLFKESAQIKILQNGSITTFETLTGINLKVGSYVLLTNDSNLDAYGYIRSINEETNQYTVEVKTDASAATVVVHLADESDGNFSNHLLIGVNSQDNSNKNLYPKAITFSELLGIDNTNYSPQYSTPKVLLGDLGGLHREEIGGFGLYGENVYLTGSLTTQVNVNSYAGINTLSGASATKFNKTAVVDTSKIVFWAGANGTAADNIQDSKFQVTESGSLYAAQGLFEGSIITHSMIQASDLYAIRLFGGTEDETAALNIYDTVAGIVFKTREIGNQVEKETLRLNANGFSIDGGNTNFIKIEEEGVTRKVFFDGEQLRANTIITGPIGANYLNLNGSLIDAYGAGEVPVSLGSLIWGIDSSGSTYYSIGINTNNNTNDNITQDRNQINLSTNLVQVRNNIYFSNKMKYENVTNGYDLYVSE